MPHLNRLRARGPGLALLVLLVVIGVAGAAWRTIHPDDAVTRMEPIRHRELQALHITDPFADQRAAELAKVDGRFAAHPVLVVLHSVAGGLFLLAAPLQFSGYIRRRHLHWHRWSGRILLLLGVPIVLTALFFGVLMPYAGPFEALLIAVIGILFVTAAIRAWLAIRRKETTRHREWMIRVFASAISISTVRALGPVMDPVLTMAGVHPRTSFLLVIWAGWILTLGVAELWIRRTRGPAAALAPAVAAD